MKKLILLLCISVMLAGCGKENTESSSAAEVTEIVTEQVETEITTEQTTENTSVNITLDEATEKLWSLIDTGEENQHLAYEEIRDYSKRQCYLFREYNDFDTHRATTGWYAVDIKTGECFDALNELIPLETEERERTNLYAKQSYKQLLENVYYEMKFPDYDYNEENYLSSYSMEENEFAIFDIDNDGSDELILMFTSSGMAGMVGYIYDNDSEGHIVEEFRGFPSLRFYDNGVIEENISHNQGNSGGFWPYTLYKYDTETDTYQEIAHVSAIDRELIEYKNQMAEDAGVEKVWEYPHDIDVSNSGFVYNILKPEDKKTKSEDYVYVDVTEYEKWHNSYIDDAELIELPFINMTEENIENVIQ